MIKIVTKTFDYETLSKDAAGKLRYYEGGALLTAHKQHIEAIMKVGELLSCAKEQILADGKNESTFKSWVNATQPFSASTAYNYLNAWVKFGASPNFGLVEPSAMYVLAGNEEARAEALRLAKKGEKITHKLAKELIASVAEKDEETVAAEPESPQTTAPTGVASDWEPPDSGDRTPAEPVVGEPVDSVSDVREPPGSHQGVTGESPGSHRGEQPEVVGTMENVPTDPCRNCKGTNWVEDDNGIFCLDCKEPYNLSEAEPAPEPAKPPTPFEEFVIKWNIHIDPIFEPADETSQAAMVAFVLDLLKS